jgi:hypothetical protein
VTAGDFPNIPARTGTSAGETGAGSLSDAVGRPVACGDIVKAVEGERDALGVVLNAGGQHVLVHHGDGTQSVLPADEVVVVQRVPRKGTGTGVAL